MQASNYKYEYEKKFGVQKRVSLPLMAHINSRNLCQSAHFRENLKRKTIEEW
ncbi:hypothetical protein X798_01058 [Onchocerca flexuosa]|uniref:Uncharacterized protein n=1 Tax=Onchocerca flexuosa TaxID=387005 RepID=A0A238C354_9BILA|nr:hypothetical protein X798_01058 [Onchocerca flexuosa]